MLRVKRKSDDFDDIGQNPYGDEIAGFDDPGEIENDFASAPAPTETAQPMNASVALKIVNPKGYQDCQEIAGYLMNGNTVLLNIENMAREQAIRLLDYLSGVTYAVGGLMTKVGKTTIVVAPKNVDVSSIEAMVGGN